MSNSTSSRATDDCNDIAGKVAPVVDRDRCEGKSDCVRVCPFDVFEIRTLTVQQRRELTLFGRLKALAHGNQQAFVVKPFDCHACRLCISACPEHALQLAPLEAAPTGR